MEDFRHLGCFLLLVGVGLFSPTVCATPPAQTLADATRTEVAAMDSRSDQHSSSSPLPAMPANPQGQPSGTFVAELEHAPYPYTGQYADNDIDFFDYVSPESGERFHTNRYGVRYSEKSHYRDNRVLFHIPSHFDPQKPFFYLVFFHAIDTDIFKSDRDYALTRQLEASGSNAIFIMPQLAKDAADSSPGKFFRRNAFKAFMEEAATILAARLEAGHQRSLEDAPIVLSAFSGGYKAAAFVLDRGGVEERIAGVLLLDALYEDVDKFHKWIMENIQRSFFVSIYGQGTCATNSRELARLLNREESLDQPVWPDEISRGTITLISSHHEHLQIPLLGPPREPITTLLRTISMDELIIHRGPAKSKKREGR
jgi:hypothetical protein